MRPSRPTGAPRPVAWGELPALRAWLASAPGAYAVPIAALDGLRGAHAWDLVDGAVFADLSPVAGQLAAADALATAARSPDRAERATVAPSGPSAAVLAFAADTVVVLGDPAVVDDIARRIVRHVPVRTLLGDPEAVETFAARHAPGVPSMRLMHHSLALWQLPPTAGGRPPRVAGGVDLDALRDATLAMFLEEAGVPLHTDRIGGVVRAAEAKVATGQCWVERDWVTDALLFKASAVVAEPWEAQLEGVWVAPHARRQGRARAHVAAICAELLRTCRRVTLQVRVDNAPALALYASLGFERCGAQEVRFFDP